MCPAMKSVIAGLIAASFCAISGSLLLISFFKKKFIKNINDYANREKVT